MSSTAYAGFQESKRHGREAFPFDTYLCTLPLDQAEVPLHWHEELELVYIKKGSGTVSVALTDYTVGPGSIVLVLPGRLHAIRAPHRRRMEYETIIFSTELLRSGLLDVCTAEYLLPLFSGLLCVPVHFCPETPHYRDIADVLDTCDAIGAEKPLGAEFYIKSQLFRLFYILQNRCTMPAPEPRRIRGLDRMKAVLKLIELHYAEPLTVDQAAAVAGCSSSYFMRCFRETFQRSFIEYLKDYRLTMAARLLTSTDTGTLEIAASVGFENLSYFTRSFKKRFGVTPGQYRRNGPPTADPTHT